MGAILKRLLTLGVVLAFVVSTTAPVLPCGMAYAHGGIRADNAAEPARTKLPGADHSQMCVDHVGCVVSAAVPSSTLLVVALQWVSLGYDLRPASLSGISLKPDLSPPIRIP